MWMPFIYRKKRTRTHNCFSIFGCEPIDMVCTYIKQLSELTFTVGALSITKCI